MFFIISRRYINQHFKVKKVNNGFPSNELTNQFIQFDHSKYNKQVGECVVSNYNFFVLEKTEKLFICAYKYTNTNLSDSNEDL